ncbi:hypothetical protein MUP95_06335, partial [bacterium]|nr:hypothetical protein [bacterium]
MHNKKYYLFFKIVICFLSMIPVIAMYAQQGVQSQTMGQAAQYQLGTENDLLVPINIWGFVEKPGQYLVPMNTDLISLL